MKNKIIKCISIACLIVFSMFTFLLNFSFTPKAEAIKIEQQKQLELIMEQEKPAIDAIVDNVNFIDIGGNAYQITSKTGFNSFRDNVNSGTTYAGKTINLMCDLDFNGEKFVPIGTINSSRSSPYYFNGTFNGNGHTLSSIKISSDTTNVKGDIGVFGYVNGGIIQDLTVLIDQLYLSTAGQSIGGLIGSISNTARVFRCILMPKDSKSKIYTSSTSTSMNVGGIVGYANGTSSSIILTSANLVPLSNTVSGTVCIGGIVGKLPASSYTGINTCYSGGAITAGTSSTSTVYAGGIAGKVDRPDSSNSPVTIYCCSNNAKITASAKASASTGGSPSTATLRDTFGVKVQAAKNVTWNNSVYDIYVGGIVGYGAGCTAQYCVNNKTDHSAASSVYYDYIKYFYGYQGETTTGVPCDEAWYGDFFDITFKQTRTNVREIGFNVTAVTCFSGNIGTYYTTSTSATMYDRLYRVKITGANKNGVTGTPLTLQECVSAANTGVSYIRETSVSGSQNLIVPLAASGNSLSLANYSSNWCDDVYFYSSENGCWLRGNVYNLNTTVTSWHQLGLSMVPITNYNSLGQIYGIYDPNWFTLSGKYIYVNGAPFYGYTFSGEPHYQDLNSRSISLNTAYSSYFNSRFVNEENDDCPSKYYEKTNKGYAIYNTKISRSESTDSYTFTHNYGYSYDRYLENWTYYMKNTTGSWTLCTATSRKVDNSKISATIGNNTLLALNKDTSAFVIKDGVYTLKSLYWDQSTQAPK